MSSEIDGLAHITEGITALAALALDAHTDDDALHHSVAALQRLEQQLAAEKLRRVAELDHRKAFTGRARDTADLLATTLNLSRPEAAGMVRTATALTELPATAAALRDGHLSVAQAGIAANTLHELEILSERDLPLPADAASRLDAHVASRAPVCDRAVLRRELDALTHHLCADGLAEKETIAHERRDGRLRDHPDGTTSLHLRFGAVAGAKLRAYLDATARKTSPDDVRPRGQRIADAVIDLVDHGLQQDLPEVAARRPHAILVTTPEAQHGLPGAEPAWLDGHGPVSSATAAQICCDAEVTVIIRTADGKTIDAKPWRAKPTTAQRAGVIGRDKRCVGCGAAASRCEIHHIQWRRRNGKTVVSKLVLVCWNCHHRIHHDSWTVDTDEQGNFVLRPPRLERHIA